MNSSKDCRRLISEFNEYKKSEKNDINDKKTNLESILKDIHESDKNHLIDAYNAACDVAKDYNWYEIHCVKNNEIRTIEDIHEEIYKEIKKHI